MSSKKKKKFLFSTYKYLHISLFFSSPSSHSKSLPNSKFLRQFSHNSPELFVDPVDTGLEEGLLSYLPLSALLPKYLQNPNLNFGKGAPAHLTQGSCTEIPMFLPVDTGVFPYFVSPSSLITSHFHCYTYLSSNPLFSDLVKKKIKKKKSLSPRKHPSYQLKFAKF